MRNYVIINGINSLTIQGLAINNLPPITKPMIRTQREEIDGRDGDIVTELGYSAYDKSMEIGLYGNFDIDAIIKYFTGEGTIVFSNEADKYYNFKILDQIDYEKLLKFKTAVVTFHCQPFKYPLEEEPEEAEITTITGTGESITLENVEEAPMSLTYKGNTSQTGTPTPTTPIPVQVVSGDNTIKIEGKNLLSISSVKGYGYNFGLPDIETQLMVIDSFDSNSITYHSTTSNYLMALTNIIKLKPNTTYTLSYKRTTTSTNNQVFVYDYDGSNYSINQRDNNTNLPKITFTTNNIGNIALAFGYAQASGSTTISDIQIEVGDTKTTYEPYKSQSYSVNLGDIELCKIGNYQDKIDKSSGKNLFDNSKAQIGKAWNNASNTARAIVITKVKPSTTYYLSYLNKSAVDDIYWFDRVNEDDSTYITGNTQITQPLSITTKPNCNYLGIQFNKTSITQADIEKVGIMLNEGKTVLPYEPYGTNWYLKKEIGKVVLNGSENWQQSGTYTNNTIYSVYSGVITNYNYGQAISDLFIWNNNISPSTITEYIATGGDTLRIGVLKNRLSAYTINEFKTWLSNNNVTTYYVLATPTYTLIEDSTLIEELESMKKSYENQTNISQTNNDLPFELDVSVTFLTPMEINNIGNIYAKPILTIEGTGNIGVVLNDIQILDIDLTNNGKIAIDVPKLEAYNPDDDTLLNRLVTGDYMKLLINEGENTITFTGNVSGATLTNYIRWI